MKARADELKRTKKGSKKADLEQDLLNAIQAMPEPDRSTSTRLHALIKAAAPELQPKTWYGMPAYADKDGKVFIGRSAPMSVKRGDIFTYTIFIGALADVPMRAAKIGITVPAGCEA